MTEQEMPQLFQDIHARHGHYCPMSTLGGRLGLAARAALAPAAGRLRARYRIATCAVDGVALATGCLPEDGLLVVQPDGRHRLELWDVAAQRGISAELTESALVRAAAWRELQDQGDVEAAEALLAELRAASADELLRLLPLDEWREGDA